MPTVKITPEHLDKLTAVAKARGTDVAGAFAHAVDLAHAAHVGGHPPSNAGASDGEDELERERRESDARTALASEKASLDVVNAKDEAGRPISKKDHIQQKLGTVGASDDDGGKKSGRPNPLKAWAGR